MKFVNPICVLFVMFAIQGYAGNIVVTDGNWSQEYYIADSDMISQHGSTFTLENKDVEFGYIPDPYIPPKRVYIDEEDGFVKIRMDDPEPNLNDEEVRVTDAVVTMYSEVHTNWVDSGMATSTLLWPPEANTTTFQEIGTVVSNKYLRIRWKEHDKSILIDTIIFDTIYRSYTLETKKVYK